LTTRSQAVTIFSHQEYVTTADWALKFIKINGGGRKILVFELLTNLRDTQLSQMKILNFIFRRFEIYVCVWAVKRI
jgi:hypothetical protein